MTLDPNDPRVSTLTPADRRMIEFIADILESVIGTIVPLERERPGASSITVAALIDVAARITAACPDDLRGNAVESFQNQLLRNTARYADERKAAIARGEL